MQAVSHSVFHPLHIADNARFQISQYIVLVLSHIPEGRTLFQWLPSPFPRSVTRLPWSSVPPASILKSLFLSLFYPAPLKTVKSGFSLRKLIQFMQTDFRRPVNKFPDHLSGQKKLLFLPLGEIVHVLPLPVPAHENLLIP